MIGRGIVRVGLAGAIATLVAMPAAAAARTTVTRIVSDPNATRLGMPGVAVTVRGPSPDRAAIVRARLVADLAKLVYTRSLAPGEEGDYDLTVTLAPRRDGAASVTIPFEAVLTAADGAELWRATGRTEVTDAPVGAPVLASVARNVLSALVRDGWLATRYDPDNPPPATPHLRRE